MSNPIQDIQSATENLAKVMARNEAFEKGYADIFYEQLV